MGAAFAVRTSYPSLLRSAGFAAAEDIDVTDAYRAIQRRWIDATERREAALRAVMGDEPFVERMTSRRRTLAAIDDGILQRRMYTAVR